MTDPAPTAVAPLLARICDPETPRDEALGLCAGLIDNELFTAMRFHAQAMEVERLYSTRPEVYPVSGRKPKRDTEWGDRVLIRRQVNLGFGAEDIAWAFDDHATILGLGLNAVMNVPVVRAGQVLGTINFLRARPRFGSADVTLGLSIAAALAGRGDTLG